MDVPSTTQLHVRISCSMDWLHVRNAFVLLNTLEAIVHRLQRSDKRNIRWSVRVAGIWIDVVVDSGPGAAASERVRYELNERVYYVSSKDIQF